MAMSWPMAVFFHAIPASGDTDRGEYFDISLSQGVKVFLEVPHFYNSETKTLLLMA